MLHSSVQSPCFRCLQAQKYTGHVCIRSIRVLHRVALASQQVSCSSSSSSSTSGEGTPKNAAQATPPGAQRSKSSKQSNISKTATGSRKPTKPKQSPRRPTHKSPPAASKQAQPTTGDSSVQKRTSSNSSSLVIDTQLSPFTNVRFKTFQQLQHLVWSHGSSARIADITAMMSRLKQVPGSSAGSRAALLGELWQLLQPQLPHAADRHCAEVMLTASKLGHGPDGLYEACLKQFIARVQRSETRILSNVLYAVATAPSGSIPTASQQQLESVLLPQLVKKAAEANSQSIANTTYALALMQQTGPSDNRRKEQLQLLLGAVQPSIWSASVGQELSNTIWGAGVLGIELPPPHLQALLARSLSTLQEASAQDIGNYMYGLTLLQQQLTVEQHAQLLSALLEKQPDPQAISGFLRASAKMGLELQQHEVDALISQLLACKGDLPPQSISLALWGAVAAERSIAHSALLQLLQQLAAAEPEPQALSLSLWAAARMQAEVPTWLLDQLYQQLAAVAEQADPQAMSNALWAGAMLPQPYLPHALLGPPPAPAQQEQQRQGGKQQQLPRKQKQDQQVVRQGRGGKQKQGAEAAVGVFAAKVSGMKPLELSSVALALAVLGCRRLDILDAVYDAAKQHLQDTGTCSSGSSSGSSSKEAGAGFHLQAGFDPLPAAPEAGSTNSHRGDGNGSAPGDLTPQACSNLCWAGAILNLRGRRHQLQALAASCASSWEPGHENVREAMQLYQLHLWLTECVGGEGLEGVLTDAQLQQCRRSMQAVVVAEARPSGLQQQVWEAAQRLQGVRDAQLEAVTEDGLLSVDIAAVWGRDAAQGGSGDAGSGEAAAAGAGAAAAAADGDGAGADEQQQQHKVRIAIEVDGPWHYRRPDRKQTGPTLLRNKLLESRGFVVVTVPYFEWQGLATGARGSYLQQAIAAAAGGCKQRSGV